MARATSKPSKASRLNHPGTDDQAMRKTGIRLLGNAPWGTHVCVFYETRSDLIGTVACFLRAGLENNELCVWVLSEPVTMLGAARGLRERIKDFDAHLATGRIRLLPGREWYLNKDEFSLERIFDALEEMLQTAAQGFDGLRVSGNAFWLETKHWPEFRAYESTIHNALNGLKVLAMCTYPLQASKAIDILDVVRAHHSTIARRKGEWEVLTTPELKRAKRERTKVRGAVNMLSKPFPGRTMLTPSERRALAQIARGASSKEAGRALGISPRTVEFHRANIMKKLGAKNTADLMRKLFFEA